MRSPTTNFHAASEYCDEHITVLKSNNTYHYRIYDLFLTKSGTLYDSILVLTLGN